MCCIKVETWTMWLAAASLARLIQGSLGCGDNPTSLAKVGEKVDNTCEGCDAHMGVERGCTEDDERVYRL